MEDYKNDFKNIYKLIEKIESLLIKIKKENQNNVNEIIKKEDLNFFFNMKDNCIFLNDLIIYFYSLYYMNFYNYLIDLNNTIKIKTEYLKK